MTAAAGAGPAAATYGARVGARRLLSSAFLVGCVIAILIGLALLGALVFDVARDGGAVAFTSGGTDGLPSGMGWMAWAVPAAMAAPFLLPRLAFSLAGARGRRLQLLAVASTAPIAVFIHLLYALYESAPPGADPSYYIELDGPRHVFALLGGASGWQFVRILLFGFLIPGGLLAWAWRGADRLRSPSLIFPLLGIGAWCAYLFLDSGFLHNFQSSSPDRAGIFTAVTGTLYMMAITAAVAFPLGVGAAVYLEEYARRSWFSRMIQVNISNLAGVPSIIYGLLGLQLFVRALEFERSVLAGAFTMALLVMPIIVVAAQESLRAVPPSMREAAYAVGATRWQVVRHHVLPYAFGGMLTGNILAMSRAIGETAPLIAIGALTFITFLADDPRDDFTVLPIMIFNYVSRPQAGFHAVAAGAIIVLLAVLLLMNSTAIIMRHRTRTEW